MQDKTTHFEIPLTVRVEADSFDAAVGYLSRTFTSPDAIDGEPVEWVRFGISDDALKGSDLLAYTRADGMIGRMDDAANIDNVVPYLTDVKLAEGVGA